MVQAQVLKLVAQGSDIVMAPVGGTPVLLYDAGIIATGTAKLAAQVANFLRSGCASVQISILPHHLGSHDEEEFRSELVRHLGSLALLPEEQFEFQRTDLRGNIALGAVFRVFRIFSGE